MTCSSLAVPPGGRLVDLRVTAAERAAVQAAAGEARSVLLTADASLELLWLTWGARSPLTRFETPVGTSGRFAPPQVGEAAALRDADGHLLALLPVIEIRTGNPSDAGGADGEVLIAGCPRVLDAPVPTALRRLSWRPAEVREILERHGRSPVLGWYGKNCPTEAVLDQGLALADELTGVFLVVVGLPRESGAMDRRAAEVAVLGERLGRRRAVVAAGPELGADAGSDAEIRVLRTYGAERVLLPEGSESSGESATDAAAFGAFGGRPA